MQYPHNSHDRNTSPSPHVPANLPRIQLEIVQGQARHPIRQIEQRAYLFGSSDQCDLVLQDSSVDEVLGYILNTPQGVWVRQLGHQGSLLVNGRPVSCMLLLDKDRLRVGPFEFRVHIQAAGTLALRVHTGEVPSAVPVSHRLPGAGGQTPRRLSGHVDVRRERVDASHARVDASHAAAPAPKFLRRATAVSRGAQHASVAPPSWKHMSREILFD